MFDRPKTLPAYEVSAKAYQAAELIGKAAALLDEIGDRAATENRRRLASIAGQSSVTMELSRRVEEFAAKLMQEHEAACAQDDLEMALMDAAAHAARVIEAAERV